MHFDEFVDLLALLGELLGAACHHVLQLVLVLRQLRQNVLDGSRAQHTSDQAIAFSSLIDGCQSFDNGPGAEQTSKFANVVGGIEASGINVIVLFGRTREEGEVMLTYVL